MKRRDTDTIVETMGRDWPVLMVRCPRCRARPHEGCRSTKSPGGARTPRPHWARKTRATRLLARRWCCGCANRSGGNPHFASLPCVRGHIHNICPNCFRFIVKVGLFNVEEVPIGCPNDHGLRKQITAEMAMKNLRDAEWHPE